MSRLKISPNLFLEVNELNKLIQFLDDEGYKLYLKNLTKSFGIAQNEENTFFKVSRKVGAQNIVIVNAGYAFDNELRRICLEDDLEVEIPNTGTAHWLLVSYDTTNNERGVVRVTKQGQMSGVGTEFLSVLRGQPNFPTKVRFESELNTEEYEVVNISSDTEALIAGDLKDETDLRYSVIGTFTPGFQPKEEDKTIYEYDYCDVEVVESADVPDLADGQYLLAKVEYVNDVLQVSDERARNMFNTESTVIENINTYDLVADPLVALRRTAQRNTILDVEFEWGYVVSSYETAVTSEQNRFIIKSGRSNFLTDKIPDGIFKGWLLINRSNMVSSVISDNENKTLFIENLDPNLFTDDYSEFYIVPNVKEIEVEVRLNSMVDYGGKYYYKFSIENAAAHFLLPLEYGKTEIGLQYRLLSATETTKWQLFSNAKFINTENTNETLGQSSFVANMIRPEEVKRNYS